MTNTIYESESSDIPLFLIFESKFPLIPLMPKAAKASFSGFPPSSSSYHQSHHRSTGSTDLLVTSLFSGDQLLPLTTYDRISNL